MNPVSKIEKYLCYLLGEIDDAPTNPVSKIDKYWHYLCGEDIELPKPVSNIEKYLYYLCGEDIQLPNSSTNHDIYYKMLCGEDLDAPKPVSRIDILLNELVENGGVGVKRAKATVIPSTLSGSYEEEISTLSFTITNLEKGDNEIATIEIYKDNVLQKTITYSNSISSYSYTYSNTIDEDTIFKVKIVDSEGYKKSYTFTYKFEVGILDADGYICVDADGYICDVA